MILVYLIKGPMQNGLLYYYQKTQILFCLYNFPFYTDKLYVYVMVFYDCEDNRVLVRKHLYAFSVIPARYEYMYQYGERTESIETDEVCYSKVLYHHRNKDETIISVIKRLFGEHVTSRSINRQNRELSFRC
jgi:hypothetical protein